MGFIFLPKLAMSSDTKLAKDQREALGILAASLRGRMESVMLPTPSQSERCAAQCVRDWRQQFRGAAHFDRHAIVCCR
jgi:hypothetical protein